MHETKRKNGMTICTIDGVNNWPGWACDDPQPGTWWKQRRNEAKIGRVYYMRWVYDDNENECGDLDLDPEIGIKYGDKVEWVPVSKWKKIMSPHEKKFYK